MKHDTLPDQQQQAEEYGGPSPEDESWLQDQGYPHLGRNAHHRLTQVEHGPYPGGTQQRAAETPDRVADQ
jgi:hypothetical protein